MSLACIKNLFLVTALAADNVGLSPTVLDDIAARLVSLQTSLIPTVSDTVLRRTRAALHT